MNETYQLNCFDLFVTNDTQRAPSLLDFPENGISVFHFKVNLQRANLCTSGAFLIPTSPESTGNIREKLKNEFVHKLICSKDAPCTIYTNSFESPATWCFDPKDWVEYVRRSS